MNMMHGIAIARPASSQGTKSAGATVLTGRYAPPESGPSIATASAVHNVRYREEQTFV